MQAKSFTSRHLEKVSFLYNIIKFRWQYLMILPGIIFLILFNYIPIIGLQIAFKDFQIGTTIWTCPWVGLDNFSFLSDPEFWRVVKNTLAITSLKFVFNFFAPIIFALLLNEVTTVWFKRTIQTISYLPHFISWIVIAYLIEAFLAPDALVNQIIWALNGKQIYFMGEPSWFRPIIVVSSVWKEVGWGSIIYLAAISSIDTEMYEAAYLEGAGKWAQLRFITLPCLMPTIVLLLILNMPSLLNAGFDQIYPLMNGANMIVSDVLDTYVLRTGLQQGYFSQAAAVGMLSSIISYILIFTTNSLAKALNGEGLW
ncbi:MAG TPA: ABC transporter permease subunit [Thermoclostridium sp.]